MASRETVSPARIADFKSFSRRCRTVGSAIVDLRSFSNQARASRSPEPCLELSATEQMKMKMRDRLSGIGAVIGDDPVAAVIEPILGGDACGQRQRVRRDVPIVAADRTQGREVLPRHDEHVDRRLRVEVAEGDVMLALSDELRPELAAGDATEDAIGNTRIVQV